MRGMAFGRVGAALALAWAFAAAGGAEEADPGPARVALRAGDDAARAETPPPMPELSSVQERLLAEVTPELLGAWDLEAGLDALLRDAGPSDDANAAVHFKALEALYPAERTPGKATVPSEASGVDRLVEAAACRTCVLTPDVYPPMDRATRPQPEYVVYVAYIRALLERADGYANAGRGREAEALYRAGLLCGRHLVRDRSSLIVLMLGLSYQQRSADRYARFLRRQLRYDEAAAAEAVTKNIREKQNWLGVKAQVLMGEFREFACLPATAKIAAEDAEPCWRQEAVLRLGVLRHGAPWGADADGTPLVTHDDAWQRYAEYALTRTAETESKPWIRDLAAWTFQQITPESFVEMRHKALTSQNALISTD